MSTPAGQRAHVKLSWLRAVFPLPCSGESAWTSERPALQSRKVHSLRPGSEALFASGGGGGDFWFDALSSFRPPPHPPLQRLGEEARPCLAGTGHPFSPNHIEIYCLSSQVPGIAGGGGGCPCGGPPPSAFVTAELFGRGQGLSCGWEIDRTCL